MEYYRATVGVNNQFIELQINLFLWTQQKVTGEQDLQKTAIILTKIEDRPQLEVAEIMNTSVKAVESLLQRAKQTIQKKLTETEGL